MAEKKVSDLLPFWKDQYQKGRVALDRKNYDYAMMIFCQLLDQEPGCLDCREALRVTQFRKAEETGQRSFFKKAFGMTGDLAHLSKARMILKNNPGEAMSALEQVLNKDPQNVSAHQLMADAALSAGYIRTALISLELLFNKLGQRDMAMARKLADVYSQAGLPGKAEEIYAQLVNENPDNLDLIQALKDVSASRTMKEGGYESAAEGGTYRDALKSEDESKRLEQEARLVQTSDSSEAIIKNLEDKVAAEPTSLRWWRALADQYLRIKEYEKALSAYESLKALLSVSDPQLSMNILKVKLRILDSQLASMDPQDPAQTEKIAELQKQRAEVEMAEVESLSEANPTDMIILFDLASLYFKNGKLGKAIQALQKTQNYPGKKIPSLLLLGQCFARRKMYDLAVRAYSNALADKKSMDEEKKELLYLLGITYEMMGKKEEAIEQFKLIYEVDIDYRDVAAHVDAYYSENE